MTLAARATDAKICLWQIKHRRVQTAAVGYVGVFMYSLAGCSRFYGQNYIL